MNDWPSDDRPSGILQRRRRFGIEKFIALTAAIGIGAGAGVAAWTLLRGDDEDEPEAEPTPDDGTTGATGTTGERPEYPPDVGAPRLDLGGALRLDMPEPWWDDPSQAPSDPAGPDVEVPDWE